MLVEQWGVSVRPASTHADRIMSNAAWYCARSPSRVNAPSTPIAQRAARAIAFGPIEPAASGGPPGCTGGGPTGSAPSKGGSPAQMRRITTIWSSMRCHRRSNGAETAR